MWRAVAASIVVVPCLTACGANRSGGTSALAPGDVWIQDVTLISAERAMPLSHAHVVVRGGKTSAEAARRAAEQIDAVKGRILGVLLNRVDMRPGGYYADQHRYYDAYYGSDHKE